ncbi:hypothetical protein AN958_00091 [Leucoagaricus sp. SymC.cos]|nr:hypothetical protein AN958_00091 [Leucoagaricus sp. SymC.cos]
MILVIKRPNDAVHFVLRDAAVRTGREMVVEISSAEVQPMLMPHNLNINHDHHFSPEVGIIVFGLRSISQSYLRAVRWKSLALSSSPVRDPT